MEDSCKPNSLQHSSDTIHVEIGGLLLGAPWQENEALGSARTWAPSPSSSSTLSSVRRRRRHTSLTLATSPSFTPTTDTTGVWPTVASSACPAAMDLGLAYKPVLLPRDVAAQYYPSGAYRFKQSSSITSRLSEAGPAYIWQLNLGYRLPSQTNTSLFCALCPHSCAPGNNFLVGHPSPNCFGPSTLNLGVLWRSAFEKKVATC